jgi:hypothetical protein
MIKQMRIMKKRERVYLGICFGILGAVLIPLLAVFLAQGKVGAALISLAAVSIGFSLTCVPVLAKEHVGLWTLGAFFTSLNLTLLLACLFTGGNWFFLVFVVLIFSFSIVFLPFIIRAIPLPLPLLNHKAVCCFAVDTFLLLFMLLAIMLKTGNVQEFFTMGVPITLAMSLLPWGIMLIIRYIRLNGWFRAAICILFVAIWQLLADLTLHLTSLGQARIALQEANLYMWNEVSYNGNITLLSLLSLIVIGIILAVVGQIVKQSSKN